MSINEQPEPEIVCDVCSTPLAFSYDDNVGVLVEPCVKCMEAAKESGHHEGYVECDGERWQEEGERFTINRDEIRNLAVASAKSVYNAMVRINRYTPFMDVLCDAIFEAFNEHFKTYKGGEEGVIADWKKAQVVLDTGGEDQAQ